MTSDKWEVSVVIPCLNEESTIGHCVLEALEAFRMARLSGEVVVVDNGSLDKSMSIAKAAGAIVIQERGVGYGCALMTGVGHSRGKWILTTDGDGTYDLSDLENLLSHLRAGHDVVLGSRLGGTIDDGAMPILNRYLGTPLFNFLILVLFGRILSDCQTGLKGFPRTLLRDLSMQARGMEFNMEFLAKVLARKFSLVEVPIHYRRGPRGRRPHLRPVRDGVRNLFSLMCHRVASLH